MIKLLFTAKYLAIIAVITFFAGCALIDPPENTPASQELSNLIITEIHYNPLPLDPVLGEEFEFIELYNKGTSDISLSKVTISDGISYTFAATAKIKAGEHIVLAANKTEFKNRYNFDPFDQYTGRLKDSGERIALMDIDAQKEFLAIEYGDKDLWPIMADGFGYSLVLKTESATDISSPSQWRVSSKLHGSPANLDPLPVYINEIMPHTDPPLEDAIELFNPNSTPVDIGGWFLTDRFDMPFKFRIPDGTIIGANGYHVFYSHQFNDTVNLSNPFNLSENGEEVYIFADTSDPQARGYYHGFSYDAIDLGITYGRFINSSGEEKFVELITSTLGANNTTPTISNKIVITEIMYNPSNGRDEFIEIKNISSELIPLFDPEHPVNTWKIKGFDFVFPTAVSLKSGEIAIITSDTIPSETFRTQYSVPDSVRIFSTALGGLKNSGDTITILMPLKPNTLGTDDIRVPYRAVDKITYSDGKLWPSGADGLGSSLTRKRTDQFTDDPSNWADGVPSPGIHTNP